MLQDILTLHGKPTAEIVNALNICGQLFHAHQGKEFALGIDNVINSFSGNHDMY